MKDLITELQAASRRVDDGTLPAGTAEVVTLDRVYAAEVEDVWDALTDPERIAGWFLPVTGDLRLGGTYQLEGNAGGEIRVCEPPRRLQVTWILGEPPGPEDSSLVEVRLESTPDGGTKLVLEHTAVVPPDMWDQFGPGAVGVGWGPLAPRSRRPPRRCRDGRPRGSGARPGHAQRDDGEQPGVGAGVPGVRRRCRHGRPRGGGHHRVRGPRRPASRGGRRSARR
jgi:uncharacterized protein YndB with AHSA1/START domain